MTKLPNPYFEGNISDSLSADRPKQFIITKKNTKINENCLDETLMSSTQSVADETPFAGKKLADAGHGSKFQTNLLILYSVRAIRFCYQFYLGNDLPDAGDKLDDLIFHYRDEEQIHSKDDKKTSFRQQYLQAKQRLNVNKKITAANLLDENNGDFGLLKYFQSYVKIKSKRNNVEHCIICTNADLNYDNLDQNGINLKEIEHEKWPKLLDCTDVKKEQKCYRLVFGHEKFKSISCDSKRSWVISKTREEIKYLFENCEDEMIKNLFVNCADKVNEKQFCDYTADEIKDVFNNLQDKKEMQNLFQNMGETIVANIFEGFFVCFFNDFLDKLIFVVNMPNEDELDSILVKEVGNYFQLSNAALQSAYVINKMVNWFKRQDNLWLTDKDAKDIIREKTVELMTLNEITSFSNNYQKQLEKLVEFNNSAIEELTPYLKSPDERIKHFSSETPKLTAAKVISAINMSIFQNKDDYLIISSNCLKENIKQWENSLEVEKCHCLLVIVDEDANDPLVDDTCYENLVPKNSNKRVILISSQNFRKLKPSFEDRITYKQLSENAQKIIGKKKVKFLGSVRTINQLIHESILLESKLIENLLQTNEDETISMPSSFSSSDFNQSLYITRKIKFHLKDQLLHELAKDYGEKIKEEIDIDHNGKIQWLIQDDKRKKIIWKNLKVLLERINMLDPSSKSDVNDEELFDSNNKRIIITGVAGTGKSTILSHYYKIIREKKPDNLVIKISLNNFSKILKETNDINEFLINNVIVQNEFARSLLKHRLETGDPIILMLDGFDEIDPECQSKVVQLVKSLNESIQLYITTRPHLEDKLQFELSQLAYSLDKFTEDDQINYLTSIWKEYLIKNNVVINDKKIETFARQLIDRVAATLNDQEKEFIGIPLQCRILAECFQSKMKDQIYMKTDSDHDFLLDEDQQFDSANLYKLMIEEKRRVFREKKIKDNGDGSEINNYLIESLIEDTEFHFKRKAVQTIVSDEEDLNNLIPVGSKEKNEKLFDEFGICYGLFDSKDAKNETQFLHRTFAEFLTADYIFSGFVLDEENQNKLLDNEFAREWIIQKIFENCSNYEGVIVFFNSMMREILSKEEWKKTIRERNLTDRFQKFSRDLLCGDDKRETKSCECGQKHLCWSLSDKKKTEIRVLTKALQGRNDNIILFILDCLDATIEVTKIQSAIINAGECWKTFFYHRNDVFYRILEYFEKTKLDEILIKTVLEKLGQAFNELDEEQVKPKNVEIFLDFMIRQQLNKVKFPKYRNCFEKIAAFIIPCKSNELKKKFLRIVTSYYSSNNKLIIKFMTSSFRAYLGNLEKNVVQIISSKGLTDPEKNEIEKYLIQGDMKMSQIEITLKAYLEDNENVAAALSLYFLVKTPETLKRNENATIRSSLEKMGMTGLHDVVSSGNLNDIQAKIGYCFKNPKEYSKEHRYSVLRLMTNENDFVAPLHIAAAKGHEHTCKKIMEMLDKNSFLFLKPFFLHTFLEHENVLMFQTILKSFKDVWDKNVLTKLLQSIFTDTHVSSSKITTKRMIETMVQVFVQDDGWEELNDLIFYNGENLRILECVHFEDLDRLILSAGGLEKWMTRLMNTDVYWTFHMLSSNDFLDKLKKMKKLPKLIDTLITKRPPPIQAWITSRWNKRVRTQWSFKTSSSFWSSFVKRSTTWDIQKFLTQVSECDEDTLKKLLFCRDNKNIVIIFHYFIRESSLLSSDYIKTLPENVKNKIEDLLQKEKLQLIDHFFSTPTFLKSLDQYELLNAINYCLKNGNEEQVKKFNKVVDMSQLQEALNNPANSDWMKRCTELSKFVNPRYSMENLNSIKNGKPM